MEWHLMVLLKRMARFNKIVTNRLTGTFTGRVPGVGGRQASASSSG